jgi:hypothetical protein
MTVNETKVKCMIKKTLFVAAIGLVTLPSVLLAVPTPYGNAGTANPTTYSFVATGTGPITAYFVGQSAGYGSMIGLSINGAAPLSFGLQNHIGGNTPYSTVFNMGSVVAGDVLRFVLSVDTANGQGPINPFAPSYFLNSDPSLNADGANHIYSSSYGGDNVIPAGTYVGFEDISPLSGGDRDYNDHQFVFTGVRDVQGVPDAVSTLALLAGGLTVLGAASRRLRK